jgi:calcineurin-like phosphoesterase family protein
MSGATWVMADPHFGHQGVCDFTKADGVTPLRPWNNAAEMDEALIENWNSVVKPEDRVYLLGDVAMSKRALMATVPRLRGRIVLVKGNHDNEKLRFYADLFDDVRAYVAGKGYVMSHIPIHPVSMSRWKINVHGHLHDKVVTKSAINPMYGRGQWDDEIELPDPRYICVSAEQINFTPKLLSHILSENQVT